MSFYQLFKDDTGNEPFDQKPEANRPGFWIDQMKVYVRQDEKFFSITRRHKNGTLYEFGYPLSESLYSKHQIVLKMLGSNFCSVCLFRKERNGKDLFVAPIIIRDFRNDERVQRNLRQFRYSSLGSPVVLDIAEYVEIKIKNVQDYLYLRNDFNEAMFALVVQDHDNEGFSSIHVFWYARDADGCYHGWKLSITRIQGKTLEFTGPWTFLHDGKRHRIDPEGMSLIINEPE